jgi:hypothetical protein
MVYSKALANALSPSRDLFEKISLLSVAFRNRMSTPPGIFLTH